MLISYTGGCVIYILYMYARIYTLYVYECIYRHVVHIHWRQAYRKKRNFIQRFFLGKMQGLFFSV